MPDLNGPIFQFWTGNQTVHSRSDKMEAENDQAFKFRTGDQTAKGRSDKSV
jgi:hypothetical protein